MKLSLVGMVALILAGLPGCGRREWQITVENRSNLPCDVVIKINVDGDEGAGNAGVTGLESGQQTTVLAGESKRQIRSVKLVRDGKEQAIQPNQDILPGQRFAVIVDRDGKLTVSLQ